DDEARWISDEDAPPEPARGRARLQAVESSVYDLEADGSLEGSPVPSDRARTWPPRRPVPQQHPSVIDDEDLDALNARRGLRSVPRTEDSARVRSGLEDVGPAAESGPGERGGEDIAPHGQAAGADPAEDAQTLDDPDREAALEHSAGSDDEAGDVVEDLEPAGLDDEAPDTPGSGSGSPEEPVADGGADASDPAVANRYQDTVDLTPLPGFAETDEGTPTEADEPEEPKPAKKSRPRSKRASMPSWDEIVFGSKHD